MPVISTFYGIIIRMYINDHNPPHFHAEYAGVQAIYRIQTLDVQEGGLPTRAHALVNEWASVHRNELMDNWQRLHSSQTAQKIPPLH